MRGAQRFLFPEDFGHMEDGRAAGGAGDRGAERHGDLAELQPFWTENSFSALSIVSFLNALRVGEDRAHFASRARAAGSSALFGRLVHRQRAAADIEQSRLRQFDQRLRALRQVMQPLAEALHAGLRRASIERLFHERQSSVISRSRRMPHIMGVHAGELGKIHAGGGASDVLEVEQLDGFLCGNDSVSRAPAEAQQVVAPSLRAGSPCRGKLRARPRRGAWRASRRPARGSAGCARRRALPIHSVVNHALAKALLRWSSPRMIWVMPMSRSSTTTDSMYARRARRCGA